MRSMKVSTKLGCCLSDDLKVVHHPNLDQLLPFKGVASMRGISVNASNGFEDVAPPLLRVPHIGTASRRTRSRMRALMPRSLTTSTLHPTASCSSSQSPAWSSKLRPASNSTSRCRSARRPHRGQRSQKRVHGGPRTSPRSERSLISRIGLFCRQFLAAASLRPNAAGFRVYANGVEAPLLTAGWGKEGVP